MAKLKYVDHRISEQERLMLGTTDAENVRGVKTWIKPQRMGKIF